MRKIYALLVLFLLVTGIGNVFAQYDENDVPLKGKFTSVYTRERHYTPADYIYQADAGKLAADFTSEGFSLVTKRRNPFSQPEVTMRMLYYQHKG